MEHYLEATPEAGKRFYMDFVNQGKIVMMNLLRFKEKADYSNYEQLKPDHAITGKEAYDLYLEHTLPILDQVGSSVYFLGECKHFLIGPDLEKWDAVLLVEHASAEKFIAFSQNEDYLKTSGHRAAALEDSRLLPIKELGQQFQGN